VTYNYFRQGWIVERVATMAETVFGCKPIVLSLPYLEKLSASDQTGFTLVMTTCNPAIANAFNQNGAFWLNQVPPRNLGVNGFEVKPELMPVQARESWLRIGPTSLSSGDAAPFAATDDWPFLYVRNRTIPGLSMRSMVMLGVLGISLVYYFLPKSKGCGVQINSRMFFLGAAFMLLETKAVVQLALVFGSTWLVNSLVFFTVLVMILLANLLVLKVKNVNLAWYYAGLLLFIVVGVITPVDAFLSGNWVWHYVIPCLLAVGPMFCAGVIFASSFRDVIDPAQAYGSNIAGTVVGGLCESFSMLLGFRYLLLIAMVFYVFSMWTPRLRMAR